MFTFTTFCLFNVSSKYIQEQAPEMFFKKSRKFCNIHSKTSVLGPLACKFIIKKLQHRCFLVNIVTLLKRVFNTGLFM